MPKKNKLIAYEKCTRCRYDRQKCLPEGRVWPGQRCFRCQRFDYECSASLTKREERSAELIGLSDTLRHSLPCPSLTDHKTDSNLLEELGDLRQPKNAAHTITRDQRDVVKTGDVLLQTPLHLAIKKGDRQAAEALLHRGINVDAQDDEERTALHIALINGDLNFIGFLLRKGAGVKIANSRGETALSWALGSGDKVLISMVQAFDNELEDQSGYRRQNTGFVPLNSIATRSTDLFADNERKYNYLKAHDGISSAFTTSDFSTYDHESFIAHMRPARGGHPITTPSRFFFNKARNVAW